MTTHVLLLTQDQTKRTLTLPGSCLLQFVSGYGTSAKRKMGRREAKGT